ncbi:MAG: acyl-CoA dehydrogenase [Actinobacteria bacterium]|jgi:3-oxocholest-4-en-26-oyl-CoA dehydrogenase alpha subunit|nr:acyl-CoA dehydrogenase [Actinomycetota bacterium]NCG37101.1 acyl-CoA dehydrogenase [Actinomycetota bacterium]
MHLAETPEQHALRVELREYFANLLTDEARAAIGSPGENASEFRRIIRQIGSDGWLGLAWPTEYGGQGRSAVDQFIMFDEIQRAHAPFPFVTVNTVGPAIMAHGTDEQKTRYLPGILTGELNFAVGYTEPEAGTDLASLRTSAVVDGDEFVVNGSKVYTSGANQADFIWLACRTDPDVPKHKGISIVIVPTDTPGYEWTPLVTVGDHMTTSTYYSDVRVPITNIVGELNAGWRLITLQLNHERVGLAALSGLTERLLDDVVDWCRETSSGLPDGGAMIDVAWVQTDLARCTATCKAVRLMTWRLVNAVADNSLGPAEASSVKVFSTEQVVEVYRTLQGILGPIAHLRSDSPGAFLHGELERANRAAQINTFGGGVNEIQRDLVATAGLGLKRSR